MDQMGFFLDVDITYVPGQVFVFGAMSYVTNPAARLESIETCAPGRIVHFGNLEYVADPRGELVLQGLASCRAQEEQIGFFAPPTTHYIAYVEDQQDPDNSGPSADARDLARATRAMAPTSIMAHPAGFINEIARHEFPRGFKEGIIVKQVRRISRHKHLDNSLPLCRPGGKRRRLARSQVPALHAGRIRPELVAHPTAQVYYQLGRFTSQVP